MEFIKSLYQDEINSYESQINSLKTHIKESEEKNEKLADKVKQLESLIERAHDTNKDLHSAFEHVRKENLQLQLQPAPPIEPTTSEIACPNDNLNIVIDGLQWISDKDRLTQRVKFLERECERYNRDNCTLAKQVRHLIRTLEEERGMIIRSRLEPTPKRVRGMTTALDVIDDHLVTFESIAELQEKNQKLLSMIKELGQREEEKDSKIENEDIKQLNNEIESLRAQLESIKDDRQKVLSAFNTILKERDLFKILLCKTEQAEHLTPVIFQKMVSVACSSSPALLDKPEAIEDQTSEVKDMISKLEQQIVSLRDEQEAARHKTESELKLKTELLEKAQLKIVGLSAKTEELKAQNVVLDENVNSLMQELDEVRTERQKLMFDFDQLKQNNSELRNQKAELESDLQAKTRLLEQAHHKIDNEAEEINQLQTQSMLMEENLNRIIEELRAQNVVLDENVNSLMQELDEVRTERQEVMFNFNQLEQNNSELRNQKAELESDLQAKTRLLEQAHHKIDNEMEEINQLRTRNMLMEENLNRLMEELDQVRQVNAVIDELRGVDTSHANQDSTQNTQDSGQDLSQITQDSGQTNQGIVLKRRKY